MCSGPGPEMVYPFPALPIWALTLAALAAAAVAAYGGAMASQVDDIYDYAVVFKTTDDFAAACKAAVLHEAWTQTETDAGPVATFCGVAAAFAAAVAVFLCTPCCRGRPRPGWASGLSRPLLPGGAIQAPAIPEV